MYCEVVCRLSAPLHEGQWQKNELILSLSLSLSAHNRRNMYLCHHQKRRTINDHFLISIGISRPCCPSVYSTALNKCYVLRQDGSAALLTPSSFHSCPAVRKTPRTSHTDQVTNEEVHAEIQQAVGPHGDLLTVVERRKLQWYGRVFRSSGLAKTILQGTVKGGRRQGGKAPTTPAVQG